MSDRVKYDTQKELELAWEELDKLPLEEITDVTVRIVTRNHTPYSSKQVWGALEQNPGLFFKIDEDGVMMIDRIIHYIFNHNCEQTVIKLNQKSQRLEMESMKPKLEVADAGSFVEPKDNEIAKRRKK